MNIWRSAAVTAIVGLAAAVYATDLHAQTTPSDELRFEVVSVKRNTSGAVASMWAVQPRGRLVFTNLPLRSLIVDAFGVQSFQLTGDPEWLRGERYDIQAVAPAGAPTTNDAIRAMVRRMLADRFNLRVRREVRESPIHELVLARGDRRLGDRLRQTSAECVTILSNGASPSGAAASTLPGPQDPIPCGTILSGGNRVAAGGATMPRLATLLAPRVQRIVVDKTGLPGLYDFDLQFLPDSLRGVSDGAPIRMYVVDRDVPPLTTAIQEQLGLKLQPAVGPVEYLVIQGIDRPSTD